MSIIQNMMLAFQQLIGSKKSITEQIEEAKSSALNNIKTIFSSAEHKLADERVQIGNDAKAFFRIRSQQPLFSNPLAWQSYQPITEINKNTFPDRILVGYWTDYNSICVNKEPEIVVPAYLPFFQNQRAIIIDVNNATEDAGLSLMKAIIERIYTIIPHYTKFTLIDPQTHGAAFPMKRDLETRQQDTDIYHLLDAIIADAEQITTSAALTKDDYFSSRLETITMNEKFEIICAANFPNRSGYDARTIDRLVSIGNIGYVSGKYLVIVNNQDKRDELPRDFNINKFEGAIHIDLTRRNTYIGDYAGLDDNASLVFLPEEERDKTSVLIDIGYLNTDIMIVQGDALIYMDTVEIGGGDIAADLATGLDISMLEAEEKIKRMYVFGNDSKERTYELPGSDGRKPQSFTQEEVSAIILPRVDELAEKLKEKIDESGIRLGKWSNVYLTGGGLSFNRGGRDYLGARLERTVRDVPMRTANFNSYSFSSTLGLMDLIIDTIEQNHQAAATKGGAIKAFIKSLFGG